MDHQQGQATSPESTHNADERIEEKARKEVMEMPLRNVSTVKFAQTLNQSHGDVLNYLATHLNFNRFELDKVKDYKFGGGRPHEKFVDYLLRQNIEIDDVIKAANDIENEKVVDILTNLKELGKKRMDEIDVCEALKLYRPLYHDVENPVTELTSWKMLAGELGWAHIVANIESVKFAGGVFNGGQAFVTTLGTQGKNVEYLMDVLKKDYGPDAPTMTEVANLFEEAVEKQVKLHIKKLEKEEKKYLASLR